ncbi:MULTISPECIES: hypothetical protein [unclassified Chryseobacterium]|uniref:hypothetical protein n=1 Tax=unclassified Chryseobacterium TaxID=2593645 RepID=UPI003015E27A
MDISVVILLRSSKNIIQKQAKKQIFRNSVNQTNQPKSTQSGAEAYGCLRNIFIKILSEIKSLRPKQIERVKKYCVLGGFKQFWEWLIQDDLRFDSAQRTVAGVIDNDLFKMGWQ